jgi:hypothetical protein
MTTRVAIVTALTLTSWFSGAAFAQQMRGFCPSTAGYWIENAWYPPASLSWDLQQNSSGEITGSVDIPPYCAVSTYPVVGDMYNNNAFTIVATNPAPAENCAAWFAYSGQNTKPGCNNGYGMWINSATWMDNWYWSTTCKIPSNETTQFNGAWRSDNETIAMFDVTLATGAVTFHGRDVWETAGSADDTCYFTDSAFPEITGTTEGSSVVNAINVYGDDIGFFKAAVDYYRAQGRMPCGATVEQDMVIDCDYGNPVFRHNTIQMSLTSTTVSTSRDGVVASKQYISP